VRSDIAIRSPAKPNASLSLSLSLSLRLVPGIPDTPALGSGGVEESFKIAGRKRKRTRRIKIAREEEI
jgi:hypothetical protein